MLKLLLLSLIFGSVGAIITKLLIEASMMMDFEDCILEED